jgi:hypothetical protein
MQPRLSLEQRILIFLLLAMLLSLPLVYDAAEHVARMVNGQ